VLRLTTISPLLFTAKVTTGPVQYHSRKKHRPVLEYAHRDGLNWADKTSLSLTGEGRGKEKKTIVRQELDAGTNEIPSDESSLPIRSYGPSLFTDYHSGRMSDAWRYDTVVRPAQRWKEAGRGSRESRQE